MYDIVVHDLIYLVKEVIIGYPFNAGHLEYNSGIQNAWYERSCTAELEIIVAYRCPALRGYPTELSGPVLIRRWRRRHWIEFVFRVLKHLLATESCQVHSEDSYYGHFVLRLMGSFVLFYTSRVICKGGLTMEEIIFSLKHYWRFVDLKSLELQALS